MVSGFTDGLSDDKFSTSNKSEKKYYDLVIIGGDVAGLAAVAKYREIVGSDKRIAYVSIDLLGDLVRASSEILSNYLVEVTKIRSWARIYDDLCCFEGFEFSKILDRLRIFSENNMKRRFERVFERYNVDLFIGSAKFVSRKDLVVKSSGGEVFIEGAFYILAPGSTPIIPDVEGFNEIRYYTTETIWGINDLPRELLIVGSEPLGLEIAQAFNRLGSEVHIIESSERILSIAEPEISRELSDVLSEEGVKIYTNARVTRFSRSGSRISARISRHDESFEKEFDAVLLALGRVPKTDDLGLDHAGVELDKRGYVKVSKDLRTSNPRIYAAGDVVGTPKTISTQLISVKEGCVVAENIASHRKKSVDYDLIPVVIHTDPEVAFVGYTEQRLFKALGMSSHRIVRFDATLKSDLIGVRRGLAKIIIDPREKKILGFHVMAPNASEFITVASLLIKHGYRAKEVMELAHIYPASYELLKLSAHLVFSNPDEYLHHLHQ